MNTDNNKNDNVIIFPVDKFPSPVQNMVEVHHTIREARLAYIDSIVEMIMSEFLTGAKLSGFDMTSDNENCNTVAFAAEALKGALMQSVGLAHPIQKMATQAIESATITLSENIELVDEEGIPAY